MRSTVYDISVQSSNVLVLFVRKLLSRCLLPIACLPWDCYSQQVFCTMADELIQCSKKSSKINLCEYWRFEILALLQRNTTISDFIVTTVQNPPEGRTVLWNVCSSSQGDNWKPVLCVGIMLCCWASFEHSMVLHLLATNSIMLKAVKREQEQGWWLTEEKAEKMDGCWVSCFTRKSNFQEVPSQMSYRFFLLKASHTMSTCLRIGPSVYFSTRIFWNGQGWLLFSSP